MIEAAPPCATLPPRERAERFARLEFALLLAVTAVPQVGYWLQLLAG